MRHTSKRPLLRLLLRFLSALAFCLPCAGLATALSNFAQSPPNPPTFGRAFLLPGQAEAPGYRAYSYLLLASTADSPNPATIEPLLSAYLAMDEIASLQSAGADSHDLNIVYLPLRQAPPQKPTSAWILANFDYERARAVRAAATASTQQLPALVSCTVPLPASSPIDPNELLVRNLSSGPDALISSLNVQLSPAPALKTTIRGGSRLTGRAYLIAGKPEASDYGLYSYVLFGEPVNDGNRALYRSVLDAFLHIVEVRNFEAENQPRGSLNITYLPLRELPPTGAMVDWLLDHYDFARAQIILARLYDRPTGPYVVSYQSPLSSANSIDGSRLLVEDLSRIPPDLAFLWVNEFTAQAGSARYWDKPALHNLMLHLRTQIAVDAEAFEEVRTAYHNLDSAFASRIKTQE
jgi:hypothetical protein